MPFVSGKVVFDSQSKRDQLWDTKLVPTQCGMRDCDGSPQAHTSTLTGLTPDFAVKTMQWCQLDCLWVDLPLFHVVGSHTGAVETFVQILKNASLGNFPHCRSDFQCLPWP